MYNKNLNSHYKNQRELYSAINNVLGSRGVSDYDLTTRFPFLDVLYKEDGLSYKLFHNSSLDNWITLVRDPQSEIVGEVVYTVDEYTDEIKVLDSRLKMSITNE